MRITTTVESMLKDDANMGLFHAYRVISMKKAQELREKGFEVVDSKEKECYPRMHKISWEHSTVTPSADSTKLSMAQQYWVIATDVKKAIAR